MGGLASALGSGFSQLFKAGRKYIGNKVDNFLLDAEARKAINDEVVKKFQPKIELARRAESKRADNIKDLGDKLTQSKQELADAQKAWKDNYDSALADAKAQRQTDIADYNAQLKKYQDAYDTARADKKSILAKLEDSESNYNPYKTVFIDVTNGKSYLINPSHGGYRSLDSLTKKELKYFRKNYNNFDNRLIDFTDPSGKVINAFNKSDIKQYRGKYNVFDRYYSTRISPHNADIRDADKQIQQAYNDKANWAANNPNQPQALNEKQFLRDYQKNNGKSPTYYSFNDNTYKTQKALEKAYQDALTHEQKRKDLYGKTASGFITRRDAEIAQRIQDAKDVKKAKLFLGGTLGAGALYAGAKAMYGGDDTDNGDTTNTPDNIDTTDNIDAYTGEPDPNLKIENTPEGKAIANGKSLVDTDFDPDKADAAAALSQGAYDKGVEDGNSIRSSDIVTADGQHIDDELFELLKAMKDPYKADAIANYIYSRHGDEPEVQRLGWRAWLNRYGDSLRSKMDIDPSGYNGMHISGGL